MKRCPNCHREIESNSTYCEYCGHKIKKFNSIWILVGSLVILGVAVVLFIMPRGGNKDLTGELYEIMNADFVLSKNALSEQINSKLASFEEQCALDQEKTRTYWEQAQNLKQAGDVVVKQVDSLKQVLWTNYGGKSNYSVDESLFNTLQISQQRFQEILLWIFPLSQMRNWPSPRCCLK